jgi:hypothetical protein
MATRLTYALPIAKQLALSAARRLRPDGLATALSAEGGPFVIVTGAGRSGTSAVARVLHESGVSMGDELGQASEINPDGFYEDMGVWWLHERLYAELGMATMWRLERWPWRSTVLAVAAKYRAEMAALYAKARDGWKDPRFALTLEAWLPVLPARPKVVVCLRSPHAYVDSVTRVFGLVDPRALERQWAGRYRRLLDVIRDYRLEATCVEYNALVERPEETVAALARFVGRPLRPEFVDAGRRQFSRPVPNRYARLYCEALALAGDDAPDLASPAPHEQREAPGDDEAVAAYLDATSAIERAVEEATSAWAARPAEADGASAAYSAVLKDAQERLGALDPPRRLARYHELLERDVNLLRMTAELFVAVAKDGGADRRMGRSALRAEREFASPAALAAARERRAHERAAASGHAAPSLGQRV